VTFDNPVLAGSHPDPSICRVGDDYYLATSTFALFPGIALHHSRDLVHWRPIGGALDRPEQLALDGVLMTDGIYAPTLRFHDGVFHLICTVIGADPAGNFVVTATDPAGPWSTPVWIVDAPGFDPSLLFDDDGKVWYCGTFERDPVSAPGRTTVWVQQIDPASWQLTGERHFVWTGALVDARWAEGPHLYRIDDSYYLLAAEGGTDYDHAVVVARSQAVTGPYEGCPRNPLLSSRHLGRCTDVVGPGHADLVQAPDGEWWAVLLAARPSDEDWWGTGRETFLVPMAWEGGWPVFVPGVGRVPMSSPGPSLTPHPWPAPPARDDFGAAELGPEWSTLRTPRERWWSLTERPGHLQLQLRPQTPYDLSNPSMVLRRVEHADWQATMALDFAPAAAGCRAGLVVWVNDTDQLRLESDGLQVRVVRRAAGAESVLAAFPVRRGPLVLGVEAHGRKLTARVGTADGCWADDVAADIGFLGQQVNGYFFGMLVGPYATGSEGVADIDWFDYAEV
jgi:alpha-N-arabinofuranosidase